MYYTYETYSFINYNIILKIVYATYERVEKTRNEYINIRLKDKSIINFV